MSEGGRMITLIVKQVETPEIALLAKRCGYDALYVDLEYGVIRESAVGPIAQAARKAGITALVRLPSADPACATRCLAVGMAGLVVPKVKTMDQVRSMVAAAKCAPIGQRPIDESWFTGEDAQLSADEKRARINAATTLVIMLESPEALAIAEDIAAEPGVDILHIGTADLSRSMGIAYQYDHPDILAAYRRVIAAARAHGKVAGAGGMTVNKTIAQTVIDMGVRFITGGNEWNFLQEAASARAAELRALPLA